MHYNYKAFFIFIFKTYKYRTLKIFFLSIVETLLEVLSIAVLIGVLTATLGEGNLENGIIKTLNNLSAFKSLNKINLFYLVITIYLIKNVILVAINWMKLDLCGQIYKSLSESTYKILLKKNNLFFSNYTSGHLAQNVMGESQFTKDVMMSFVTLLTEILIIIFMLLLIISQKPFVGFFTVFCIIIGSTFYYFFMKKKIFLLVRKDKVHQ